jgi:hypothetical protein
MDFMAFHMGPPGGFRKLRHAVARDHDSVFHLYFGSQLVESIQQATSLRAQNRKVQPVQARFDTLGITPSPRPDISLSATQTCPIAPPRSLFHRE